MHEPPSANGRVFTVRVEPDGRFFAASPDTTLLEAALLAGIELPSSCRNGTCRACLCLTQSGTVQYGIAWPGVSVDERREGWILPCVARPTSDLVLVQPHAVFAG